MESRRREIGQNEMASEEKARRAPPPRLKEGLMWLADSRLGESRGLYRILPNPARSSRHSARGEVIVPELLSPIPNPAIRGLSCTPPQRSTKHFIVL